MTVQLSFIVQNFIKMSTKPCWVYVTDDSPPAEREPGEVVDSLVGKQVEYAKEDGSKRTGMVIHQVEAKPSVYFIKFDDDFHIYVYDLVKTS